MKFTSVVSYHTNPMTCGVAKFSAELAKRLGVPFVALDGWPWGDFPLLSLKRSELPPDNCATAVALGFPAGARPYGVFWHDAGDQTITDRASIVYYADPSLGSPGLWCPSMMPPRTKPIRMFSFGMAHKLQTEKYRRVRELFDASGQPYHLRVSVGLHEGTSLDGAERHFDALKAIMGAEHVTILGCLSDDALAEELAHAEYVLAFFDKGLRANNTTVHAALEAGRTVLTNHDLETPSELAQATTDVFLTEFIQPFWWTRHREYSWTRLIQRMTALCEASPSTAA